MQPLCYCRDYIKRFSIVLVTLDRLMEGGTSLSVLSVSPQDSPMLSHPPSLTPLGSQRKHLLWMIKTAAKQHPEHSLDASVVR